MVHSMTQAASVGVAVCVGKPKASPETRLSAQELSSSSGPGKNVSANGSQNRDKEQFAPYYAAETKD
jgi:hypothetical protein